MRATETERAVTPPLPAMTDADPALIRRIDALNRAYAHAVDEDALERWPGFFTETGRYSITTRANHAAGMPVGLMLCEGQAMMADRIKALREANVYEPHHYRHLVEPPTIVRARPGRWTVRTGFAVYRTMQMAATTLFCTGRYLDTVVAAAAELRYAERIAVCDSEIVDTLIVIPI